MVQYANSAGRFASMICISLSLIALVSCIAGDSDDSGFNIPAWFDYHAIFPLRSAGVCAPANKFLRGIRLSWTIWKIGRGSNLAAC